MAKSRGIEPQTVFRFQLLSKQCLALLELLSIETIPAFRRGCVWRRTENSNLKPLLALTAFQAAPNPVRFILHCLVGVVGVVGFEPTYDTVYKTAALTSRATLPLFGARERIRTSMRDYPRQNLSLLCIPFHHSGECYYLSGEAPILRDTCHNEEHELSLRIRT